MSARSLKAKGFTLVEILIVVVILGILAAIVIPQFTSASEAAKASSVVTQLQGIRSQLELYQLQHNGDYPTQADFWDQMTEETLADGTTPASTSTAKTFGPYMTKASINPFEDSNTIVADTTGRVDTGAAAGVGFVYNPNTGEIKAVVSATKAADVGLDADDGDILTY